MILVDTMGAGSQDPAPFFLLLALSVNLAVASLCCLEVR